MDSHINFITSGVGVIAISYGIATAILRMKKPELFKKIGPMKEKFGAKLGLGLHFLSYTLAPIFFGVMTLTRGLQGQPLF